MHKMSLALPVCVCGLLMSLSLMAQQQQPLRNYTECKFQEFQIVQVDPLPSAMVRTIETPQGDRDVKLPEGFRVLMTYDKTEPFINMKAERLEASTYSADKQALLDNLEKLTQTPDMEAPAPGKMTLNGFDLYGINRKKLEGGVLGIYELFNDSDQTVVTFYVLNAEPSERKFQTVQKYRTIRDKFLLDYTACIRRNLSR
jgi:hypothetical protein